MVVEKRARRVVVVRSMVKETGRVVVVKRAVKEVGRVVPASRDVVVNGTTSKAAAERAREAKAGPFLCKRLESIPAI